MKPAWDQLSEEFESSTSVVVADVDCTVETELCSDYDVSGYPTIKYFTAETDEKGADYSGGRDFDGLKKFVEESLEVKCLLADDAGCSDKEKEIMAKWKDKPKADVTAQVERLGHKGLLKAFDAYGSDSAILCYLGARMATPAGQADASTTLAYIKAARKAGRADEIERVTREPQIQYEPQAVLKLLTSRQRMAGVARRSTQGLSSTCATDLT